MYLTQIYVYFSRSGRARELHVISLSKRKKFLCIIDPLWQRSWVLRCWNWKTVAESCQVFPERIKSRIADQPKGKCREAGYGTLRFLICHMHCSCFQVVHLTICRILGSNNDDLRCTSTYSEGLGDMQMVQVNSWNSLNSVGPHNTECSSTFTLGTYLQWSSWCIALIRRKFYHIGLWPINIAEHGTSFFFSMTSGSLQRETAWILNWQSLHEGS